jgi:RimJ/RimL family protein N-acetyltransferase
MQAVIARGYELGVKRFDLTCNPKNVRANKLYRSLGFKVRKHSHQMQFETKK